MSYQILAEIGEPATVDVGNRHAAKARDLRELMSRHAQRRAEARVREGG